jgi:heme-binding NEAT domain protein
MVDKKNGSNESSESHKAPVGTTKKEAVEQGLAELGSTAMPTQLRNYIQEHYHIDMDLNQISAAKSKILKAAASSSPPVPKPAAPKPSTKPQPAGSKPVAGKAEIEKGTQEISLRDIEAVKNLVERVGTTSLKMLIDVMAR